MTREEKDTVKQLAEDIIQAARHNEFAEFNHRVDAMSDIDKERDDALMELERLKARLTLARKVMRKVALIVCKDPDSLLAIHGWTKEDADASGD
jgi:hypothetical protein